MLMRTLRSQVRWIMISITVLFVLSIFGMYGFNWSRGGQGSRENGGDYAVAEIDGKSVMRSVLDKRVREHVERSGIKDISSADVPQLYKAALENLALSAGLMKEAQNSGLKASEEEINAAVKEITDQFATKEAFMQYLDQSGIKMADLRTNLGTQIVQRKLVENATSGVSVKDEELKEFYEKTKALLFHTPEGYKVDFLRVKTRDAAEKAVSALKAGEAWKSVVDSISSGDILEKTPDEGPVFFPVSGFKGKLAQLADLEAGKPSDPIEIGSSDLFVTVKREKVAERTAPFEEVSGDVKGVVLGEKQRDAQTAFFKNLRDRVSVVIHDQAIFPKPEEKKPDASAEVKKDAGNAQAPEAVQSGDAKK